MTFVLKIDDVLVPILLLSAIILVIFLIVLAHKLIKAANEIDEILKDAKTVTGVVSSRTKKVDSGIDKLTSSVMSFIKGLKRKNKNEN